MYGLTGAKANADAPVCNMHVDLDRGRTVSDYQRAMQAWLTGRNAPGEPMPEDAALLPDPNEVLSQYNAAREARRAKNVA